MLRLWEVRKKSAARIAVEPLEDRVVLSAAAAAADISYLREINRLNTLLQSRVTQIQNTTTRQVAGIDARYEAAMTRSAARLGTSDSTRAQADVAKAASTADSTLDRLTATVAGKLDTLTAQFDRKLAGVTARYGKQSSTLQAANPYVGADFQYVLSAVNTGIPAELQEAQGTLQAATAPVQSAVAQAQTSVAQAQAEVEAASSRLAATSSAQLSAEKAAVAQFWDTYYSSFTPLRAELAAIASAQLPPVHLGTGAVTGPQGQSGTSIGVNGTGTGTVTFTGLPGGDATTGSGFGIETNVGGTGGTGTGSGTTTITGGGTGTTGVGSTVTAGSGANANGAGASATGATTTGSTGTPTV